jgi:hypothetical protein
LLLIVALGGAFYWWSRGGKAAGPEPLPMGPVEQAYAPQIQFSDFQLSRATNMISTEITYVDGVVTNGGSRTVEELEISLQFHDLAGETISRQTRRLLGKGASPLGPGAKRDFELAFENVPTGWDQRPPAIVVTGLKLR